ncbi:hypothetical protein DDB_G0276401 [Dictyostelium discoideum AX4]|uniref:Uncharacterized protein n=1 Tax=Dictyostelium discoideum TaxID=44689 RepID=Q86IU4_DICDI|nr:hypothetical protein DDB_G0276401 [Dictyostelium discoideum AX4]EAL69154.1 hypothetical protein DDB_G0276401 [Dictyostelium discoideum AX4]|eukprot:XP_643084.1 hypothetical protein DDB_G0276401 [Dictyostelium discoideum AX4]
MNDEYNEKLFWKVFKNKYLLNYILKNKCCHKSKKFKTIISINSMLNHKQYQLLICKLKANENLYYGIDFESRFPKILENIGEIDDFEAFKEIHSLLFLKGYEHHGNNYSWYMKLLTRFDLGPKFEIYLDLHLKYYQQELKQYILNNMDEVFYYFDSKCINKILNCFQQQSISNKPFTLSSFERNHLLIKFLNRSNPKELMKKLKIISKIPISPTSQLKRIDENLRLSFGLYLEYLKQLKQFGLQNIPTFLLCQKLSGGEFNSEIKRYIMNDKGNLEYSSLSVYSILLYFKMYYNSYDYRSIPRSIQTQIDIIIENSKHRRCTPYQSTKQLFQLLASETKSIALYTLYLKEYDEPIETIEINEKILLYIMIKTYSINILKFLLKNHIEIESEKNKLIDDFDLYDLGKIFKNSKFDKRNIIKFFKVFSSQKSIIIKNFDQDKELYPISFNQLCMSKWKEIISNLIDKDMIVTIKDKETIDWLSDTKIGGCSYITIRDALNSKLKQLKLQFDTLELLDYARLKLNQIIQNFDSNQEICNIHILRTHDDIVSLINRLNESNFKNNEDLFKYYMVQIIQFGSRNSIKYQRLFCDNFDELRYSGTKSLDEYINTIKFVGERFIESSNCCESKPEYRKNEKPRNYKIPTQQTCQIINLSKIKVNVSHFPNATSYLLQKFIQLLDIDGVQFILDNLNGNGVGIDEYSFIDTSGLKKYICGYLYKDLMVFIQFIIDKFNQHQYNISLSNLSFSLNFLFSNLLRIKNLTIDQIKSAYQLISNYVEINCSDIHSHYYLNTLSPLIGSLSVRSFSIERFCTYETDAKVYTFGYIFKNRDNNDLHQFIDSTIMDILKKKPFKRLISFHSLLVHMLDNNNPRINLFLYYFKMQLEFIKTNEIKEPFLHYKLFKLIIKTFDLESFIKLDNLLQQYNFYFKKDEDSDEEECEYKNSKKKPKTSTSNMVEWFGVNIYKDYSDYPDIINYLYSKYSLQLEPYLEYYAFDRIKQKTFEQYCTKIPHGRRIINKKSGAERVFGI